VLAFTPYRFRKSAEPGMLCACAAAILPDQQAVGERTELHFERGYQHTDHRATEYLRRQPDSSAARMMPTLSGG
jgi:hypothetical protein